MSGEQLVLCFAVAAALVNGAIGYGFSTLVVPVALLVYPSKVLSPALVLAEVVLNLISLLLNLRGLPRVWRRVLPMLLGSLPGIGLGGVLLARASPDGMRFFTFLILLPLVLLQAAGVRRPIRSERAVGVPVGFGIGVLYACTTISGPPLGLLFNNQGLAKEDFRAALALFRVTESVATALLYLSLPLYSAQSVHLSLLLLPCIAVGLPLGRVLLSAIDPETFRRLCMTFDAWLISFALSRLLLARGGGARLSYAPMALVLAVDVAILAVYFSRRRGEPGRARPYHGAECHDEPTK